MCENTLAALHQIMDAMQDDGLQFLNDLSRNERRSFDELFHACESFLNLSDELVEEEKEKEISPWKDEDE